MRCHSLGMKCDHILVQKKMMARDETSLWKVEVTTRDTIDNVAPEILGWQWHSFNKTLNSLAGQQMNKYQKQLLPLSPLQLINTKPATNPAPPPLP